MLFRLSALAVAFSCAALTGCVSIDEAVGVPEATSWSYFQAPAGDVAVAAQDALRQGGLRVESVSETGDGGYVLNVSTRTGSAAFDQIRIQPYTYEVYESRAQTYPQGRPLPGDVRRAIAREL